MKDICPGAWSRGSKKRKEFERPKFLQPARSVIVDRSDKMSLEIKKQSQEVNNKDLDTETIDAEPQRSKATALLLISVLLATFLVALDRTIISTVR